MRSALKKTVVASILAANLMPAALFGSAALAIFALPTTTAAAHCPSGQTAVAYPGGGTDAAGNDHMCQPAATSGGFSLSDMAGRWFYSSVWVPFVSWTSSLFLDVGAGFLTVAGYLFDTLVKYVVIQFARTLDSMGMMEAIERGWTVFRDFTNILTIGFFVFIAISIILGLSEFGQKALIANVIVIAVLMNFSLLFTKLIIDGSNFFAYRVYAQMASVNGAQSADFNLSQALLKPMKPQGIWNSTGLVRGVAEKTGSTGQAFLFALFGGILLLMLAGVLFYGCFLLAWRGVLFIILMITAPLAFATYLIPTLAKGEYGWNAWWKMLINNAAFGPILMIMLAISLAILNAAGSRSTGSLGELLSAPATATPQAWTTMFVYLIGIGLLFVSFKLASSFAGSIGGGYSFATGAAKLFSKIPLMAGVGALAFGGASTLRNTVGARAAQKSRNAEKEISRLNAIASNTKLDQFTRDQARAQMEKVMKQKEAYDKRAAREFNMLNTSLGGLVAKPLGLDAGKDRGGYIGRSKETAKEAVNAAVDATISKNDARSVAQATIEKQMKPVKEAVESQRKASEALVKSAESLAEAEKAQAGHTKSIDEHMRENRDAMQQKVVIEQQFKSGKISDREREDQLRTQKERIDKANQRIQEIKDIDRKHLDAPHVKEAERAKGEAERRLADLRKEENAAVETLTNEIVSESARNAGIAIAKVKHADSYTRESIVKGLRKKNTNRRLVDQFKAVQEEAGDDATPPSSPGSTTT